MNKPKVAIVKANEYDVDVIYPAIKKAIELIGGLASIIKPDSKIFVKINHLSPASRPERGIVTHPVFVEAVLKLLKKISNNIVVGDDIESVDGGGFRLSGFQQMCERAGVRLANLKEGGFIETRCNGHTLQKVYLSKIALDADVIINLPRLKTHSLTVFTGGIKNMYGMIPSGMRTHFHGEHMGIENFSQVITDIFSAIKPYLTIMDGITGMEGEGPSNGNLRKVGLILASQDTVALDAAAAAVIGLGPMEVYTTRYAVERGLGIGDLGAIDVVGESIDSVSIPDFKMPASAINALSRKIPRPLSRYIINQITPMPYITELRCTGCLECLKICPASAISQIGKIVAIDHSRCIKCMCCHEVCRFNAITPRRPLIGRVLTTLARARR